MAYLYRHIRLDKNEVFYIGISNANDLKYSRAYNKRHRNLHWKNIVSNTEYKVDIVFDNVSWGFAKSKEIEFIKIYGKSVDNNGTLCNLTSGGDGSLNLKWSESRRHKILKAITGLKRSEESKVKMAISRKGRKLSDEHKDKISSSLINKKWTDTEIKRKSDIASKIVINLQTGIYYNSAKEAAESHGIKSSTLYNKLIGLRKNNTNIYYA